MNEDQAGKVTGGVVLGSGALCPSFIHDARWGSSPSATIGRITSKVAPSSASTSKGRRPRGSAAAAGGEAVDAFACSNGLKGLA